MVNVASVQLPPTFVPSEENIDDAIAALLRGVTVRKPHHLRSLEMFQEGHFTMVKLIWLYHPEDKYCKALNFLCGAKRNPAAAATTLGEAMNAIAEFQASEFKSAMGPKIADLLAGQKIDY